MMSKSLRAEGALRISSVLLAILSAVVVGLDSETETVFFVDKKATFKDVDALRVWIVIVPIVACYHLLQLCRCLALARFDQHPCGRSKFMAWVCFLLDQGATYVTFAGTVAATQSCAVAVFGVGHLQWSKLCNIYTRFCEQMAAGLICAIVASLAMAVVASISAHHLFRLYPSPYRRFETAPRR